MSLCSLSMKSGRRPRWSPRGQDSSLLLHLEDLFIGWPLPIFICLFMISGSDTRQWLLIVTDCKINNDCKINKNK